IVAAHDDRPMAMLRERLAVNRKQLGTRIDLTARIGALRHALVELRADAADWTVDRDGFDAVGEGLRRIYRRTRKAMAHVERQGSAEDFHAWRKGVKYHWCHTRLLSAIWPDEMTVHAEAAKALGETLGEHHDLDVLRYMIARAPGDYGDAVDVAAFLGLLATQGAQLAQHALAEGYLLLAETPDALVDRWRRYWDAWQEQGQEQVLVRASE
ncbi:MAG: CHAD domain-containing protein, partial [Sphingomonadaceae bacterium]